MNFSRFLCVASVLALSACGGGGGGTAPSIGTPASTTPVTTLRIVVPDATTASSASRAPAFVSAGAKSISVDIFPVSANGTFATSPSSTSNVDLVPSTQCSGTPLACTIPVVAPLGTVTFGVKLYAGLGETGSVLSQFAPSTQHEFTIVQNATNVLGIALNGVPSTMTVAVSPATVTAGTSSSPTVTVVARDASGNIIVGSDTYASPIALTDNDSTAHTSLSTASLTSPASTATLNYGGGSLTGSSFTLTATYPATPNPVTATGTVGILNTNGVTAVPSSIAFLSSAQPPQDVTYGEASYAGTFTIVSSSCSGIATVVDNIGSLHITPIAHGSCTITISDNAQHSATVTVGVTQTQVVGQ